MPHPFVQPDERYRSYYSGKTGRVKQQHVSTIVFDPVDYASYAFRGFDEVARAVPIAKDDSVLSFSFETAKYVPPLKVTVCTSVDGMHSDTEGVFENGIWVFTFPGPEYNVDLRMKFRLNTLSWMEGDDVFIPQYQRHRHFTDAEVFFGCRLHFQTNIWRPNHVVTLRNSIDGWGRDVFGVFNWDRWEFLLDRARYTSDFDAKFMLDRQLFMNGTDLHIPTTEWEHTWYDADVTFGATQTAYQHGYDNFIALETPFEQITLNERGNEDETYDVIVVGSGMGGGTLADSLSDKGARVLVLDAGGLWMPVHMNDLPNSDVDIAKRDMLQNYVRTGDSEFVYGVHFNLGGRSTYWSGVIPRIRTWEMRDKWPEAVRSYLMDAEDGALSGYDRAEKMLRKQKTLGPFQDFFREYLDGVFGEEFQIIDLPRSLHQPNLDESGHVQNVLEEPTGVYSTVDLLLDSLGFNGPAGRENLRVNLHNLATQIETDGADQATTVVCQDLVGNVERRYHGKYIVLACGSIESPKLVMNSGLNGNHDLMGKGLTDHPTYFYSYQNELPQEGPYGWIGDMHGHAKILMQHRTSTPTEHSFNVEMLINPKYWDVRHADDDLWDQLIESEKKSKVELQFKFGSELDDGNSITANGPHRKVDLYVKPNDTGVPFQAEVVALRNRILTALGIVPPSDVWVEGEWGNGRGGTPHHAGGSLRMSDDGTGVVDEDLKFLSYDNLYCCDPSVYPTIPAANPSLTLVALALRLADTLGERLGLV